ncbi:hypothetical protein RJ640_015302 [Escallonia rubra]|uniref:RRM domain-containing protein n=1 Tax=Escallonia rubra TaxID=112253 RepID=A0AA88UBF5_9ASTE|nr:hypothetical protein RJ640_015302 [Escallonia rubra]
MAATTAAAASDATEGPVLSLINKRLRALRKKHNRITQMEEAVSQGKPINKEQEETLKSKPSVLAAIDELEKLRQPLSAVVADETQLALERRTPTQNPPTPETLEKQADDDVIGDLLSRSPSPYKQYRRSVSRSLSRSRSMSRSYDTEVENPGNNLYVTGLSPRITKRDLEKHFSTEGTVEDVHLVVDPWTRESRGFGFVKMSTVKEADRCIRNLDRSVLEGRVIMVEKARRRRGRTPTPGRYLGLRTVHGQDRSPSYSPYSRSRSPGYSSERDRSRSRSMSPYYGRGRSYSRSRSPYSRCERSYSRDYSPDDRYYRRSSRHERSSSRYDYRYRAISRSISPRARRRDYRYRSISPSVSPRAQRRHSRRSYSRSISPRRSRRSSLRSISPRRSTRRRSRGVSPRRSSFSRRRGYSSESYSFSSGSYLRGRGGSSMSRSISRSVTPSSASRSP